MADDEAPEPAPIVEVEITVGGHTIIVKAPDSLAEVASQAYGLYEQTKLDGQKIKFGFDANSSQVELRAQPDLSHQLVEPFGPEEE